MACSSMNTDRPGRCGVVCAARPKKPAPPDSIVTFPVIRKANSSSNFARSSRGWITTWRRYVAEAFAGYLYTYPDPTLKKLQLFAQQVQAELQGDTR